METVVRIWILSLIGLSQADKSVNILTPSGSLSTFEEENILHVLSRNKTDTTKNVTFDKLISSISNYTIDAEKDIWSDGKLEMQHTNPHYGESEILYFHIKNEKYNISIIITRNKKK